ncbi:MAG TPA: HNH endonuclease signature motif containing protein [Egibacteraceae bacterium]|nr:HNH endonuclease signature motif containing protein [Egibacteraceae bacterium]
MDKVLAGQGLEKDSLDQASVAVNRALNVLKKVLPGLKTTRFHRRADFYTLVLLLHRLWDEGRTVTAHGSERNKVAGALLTEFGAAVDRVSEKQKTMKAATRAEKPLVQYLATVREGTDSQKQRQKREKILREVIESVFDHKDPQRAFNATQRRILWHAEKDPTCHFADCLSPRIKRWEDLHIDHVEPHVRGGKTVIANAALAHASCNKKWGAK